MIRQAERELERAGIQGRPWQGTLTAYTTIRLVERMGWSLGWADAFRPLTLGMVHSSARENPWPELQALLGGDADLDDASWPGLDR